MGTRIIETVALGTRPGTRRELNSTVTSARYRVYDGAMNYQYSETRYHGHLHEDVVPTTITMVRLPADRHMDFDTGSLAPRPGEPVHVLEHRILGRSVHDLYKDGTRNLIVEGRDPFGPSVDRRWAYAAGALAAITSVSIGNQLPAALLHGGIAALGLHAVLVCHRLYGMAALRTLRFLGERRIRRALGPRS